MGRRDILKRKYYCHVVNEQIADVVMEVSTQEKRVLKAVPARFVLVIDVSGSMDSQVQETRAETLLDKVKAFAKLVIHNITDKDSLAIVTFSEDAQVDFDMTMMDKKAKKRVEKAVEQMETRGSTNLEIGLVEGLNVLRRDPNRKDTKDFIIIFTDGEVNQGETDPKRLVQIYRENQSDLKRFVPLSTFTIGGYDPFLLKELASNLGCEAFYWLNAKKEFETDMLMPLFLREETHISNIRIEMNSLEGVKFCESDNSTTHLDLKNSSSTTRTYFIEGIPDTMLKHIPVQLLIPEDKFEENVGKNILRVDGAYTDNVTKEHSFTDYIALLSQIKKVKQTGTGGQEVMLEHSTYSVEDGTVLQSSSVVADSLSVIADTKYRQISVQALGDIGKCIVDNQNDMPIQQRALFDGAAADINKIKRSYLLLMKGEGPKAIQLQDNAALWIACLKEARMLQDVHDVGKIYAMQSSHSKEMPTARGVFPEGQPVPYANFKLRNKLRKYDKKLWKMKNRDLVFVTSNVFEGKTMVLSEILRCEKFGWKRDSLEDIIVHCGGGVEYDLPKCPYEPQPRWYVQKRFPNTYLICSKEDFRKSTYLVKQAELLQVPILKKKFIFRCIKKKKFIDTEDFCLQDGRKISSSMTE